MNLVPSPVVAYQHPVHGCLTVTDCAHITGVSRGKRHSSGRLNLAVMDLTRSLVETKADAYGEVQPLFAVEAEHMEILPEMLAGGDFGWRDPEWVVQWYYRRFLGGYPDAERRAAEEAYDQNTYEDVHSAITGAVGADDAATKLDHLTALSGVDVPVGSAFLQFLHPDRYLVCSEREWETLRRAGELDASYSDPPSVDEYEAYLETCRAVAERCDCSLWTLYRSLWTLGEDRHSRNEN